MAAVRFDPANATVGNTGQPLESAANGRLEATPESVWAGEVFDLGYTDRGRPQLLPGFRARRL